VKNSKYLKMLKTGSRLGDNDNNYPEIRLGLLSDNATQQIVKVLKAAMIAKGFFPIIFEGEYNTIPLEVFNNKSNLFSFKANYVFLNLSSQGYRERFYNTKVEEKTTLPQMYANEIASYINTLVDKGCEVIVNSLAMSQERLFGNYSAHTLHSIYGSILEVNRLIQKCVSEMSGCHLNDITYISAEIGITQWYDEKLWILSKYMCAPKYFPQIAESVVDIIAVSKGRLTKCLVLDLDNTLWGGVIGDDGINGIEIGELGIGEAYEHFQNYLLELKNRGYILAVCSKNEYDNAIKPFRENPNMKMKEDDFAVFVANWNNKGSNIKYIAKTLNIGLDSIIFIDDSPFERNQVRDMLPDVIVPEMPEDPSEFAAFLERSNLFEALSFSDDDQKRALMYGEQAKRANEELKFENINDYLQSLDMEIDLKVFDEFNLPRIAQLLQRSNQFNLRTRRYSEQKCKDFIEDDRYYPLYIKLKDKFGDYGLISVICAVKRDNVLEILEYVMSCRVLNRGVEMFAMQHLVSYCKKEGISKIVGEYIPTKKNNMVREFYKQFGFELIGETNEKRTWELGIDNFKKKKCFFKTE